MTKQIRIYLTVREETRSNLEKWAESQGRHLTNLASWLIEKAVEEAIESGELKPVGEPDISANADTNDLAISYIQAVANSGTINPLDLQKLADELKIPSDRLAQILVSSKGVTNGNSH